MLMPKNRNKKGFTIVELTVVIVVISILFAIVVVSYSGIKKRSLEVRISADLKNTATQLSMDLSRSGKFPDSLDQANNGNGLEYRDELTVNYVYDRINDSYCVSMFDVTDPLSIFNISSESGTILSGECSASENYIASLSVGYNHSCAILSTKKLYCWGTNANGELGIEFDSYRVTPAAVNTDGVLNGLSIEEVSTSGYYHTCAIASDKNAYCWGRNTNGQLGNSSTTQSNLPVAVNTTGALSGKTIKSISTGGSTTCAIASDDKVYCWGSNSNGQLGIGSTTQSTVPVAVDTTGVLNGKTMTSVSVGWLFTCALSSENLTYCWGSNSAGQLGDNSTTQRTVPVAVNTSGALSGKLIASISSGDEYTCAISQENRVYCWGLNDNGQLGIGSTTSSIIPVEANTSGVLSGKSLTMVATGWRHTCAVDSSNLLYCWGGNNLGQLGTDSTTLSNLPLLIDTDGIEVGSVYANAYDSCALDINGAAYCWGSGSTGQLGDGSARLSNQPVIADPENILEGKTIKLTTEGENHTCVVASDDKIYCWGYNADGQLGNGSTINSFTPVAVDFSGYLSGKTIKAISSGRGYTCVIASDNQIYCWGDNSRGVFGNNTTNDSLVPTPVTTSGALSGLDILSISTGVSGVCAVASNNKAYCWGSNFHGELGNNTTSDAYLPTALYTGGALGSQTVTAVSIGDYTGCVTTNTSKLYCWGAGDYVGDGTTIQRLGPVLITIPGLTVKTISVGHIHTCVIASNNLPYCWGGWDGDGTIGDGSSTDSNSPKAVDVSGVLFGKTIKSISSGYRHTCAIASDDKVYCWGYNSDGAIGDNSSLTNALVPTAVYWQGALSDKTAKSIGESSFHTCIIANDDKAYCWGSNYYGRLGFPHYISKYTLAPAVKF